MVTLKAIQNMTMFSDLRHNFRGRGLVSVWLRPETFLDNFNPVTPVYEVTKINQQGVVSESLPTAESAWAKYKEFSKSV